MYAVCNGMYAAMHNLHGVAMFGSLCLQSNPAVNGVPW